MRRALLIVALAGCGSPAPVDEFVGTWTCTNTSTTTFTEPPNAPPSTVTTMATVVITDDGHGNLTAVRSYTDGTPTCTLTSTLSADGMSTRLDPSQSCTGKDGGTLTFTAGSSTRTASGFSSSSTYSFTGKTAGGANVVGTGSGSGVCSM